MGQVQREKMKNVDVNILFEMPVVTKSGDVKQALGKMFNRRLNLRSNLGSQKF